MSIASDYSASASSMMEHLLTDHAYAKEIGQLPDEQINRLRGMLDEAVEQYIAPDEVYAAVTRGLRGFLARPYLRHRSSTI